MVVSNGLLSVRGRCVRSVTYPERPVMRDPDAEGTRGKDDLCACHDHGE